MITIRLEYLRFLVLVVFVIFIIRVFYLRYKESVRVKRSQSFNQADKTEVNQYKENKDYNKDNQYTVKEKTNNDEVDPWAAYDDLWEDLDKKAGKK